MKVIRRVALYVALPLALAAVAGYGWYQLSDTGKRWRYEDKLATYCNGLIPYEQSAVFTAMNVEAGLSHDGDKGGTIRGYDYCRVADIDLTISRIPDTAADLASGGYLPTNRTDEVPISLGGGWRGHTDLENTAVALTCNNKDASVVVSAQSDESHANPGEARAVAELAAATAVNAAGRWGCDAEPGGRIPPLAAPEGKKGILGAEGTCKGISFDGTDEVAWLTEAPATGTALREGCTLGETVAQDEALYYLQAEFGPFARGWRSPADDKADSGGRRGTYWATARCHGDHDRARFTVVSTAYVGETTGDAFARAALTAFAERSAERHRCTDLKLPR